MAMESNDSLTSYLKSMFVQFHGEEQLQPPSQSPAEAAAPVASSSQSAASETNASTDSMAVEGTTSGEQLEDITSLQLKEANPSQTNDEETDVNNNSEWSAETSPRKLMTNGGNSQQQSTIEVNVDVHHSGNDLIDEEATGNGESVQPVQTTLAHNKIALTFLDELKQTLQGNEGKPSGEEDAAAFADASSSELAEESLVVDKVSTTIEVEADRLSPDHQEEVTAPSSYSSSSLSPSSPSSPGPQPAARTSEQSFSSSSSVAEEATSTTESGIQEDIDDATNSGQSSSTASTPTTESSSAPTDATSSSSSNRLVRSASSNVLGSTSSLTASNGGPSASGRRMLRSVSQDVRFKLESIKEEKKVTKSHVSELANFWKGKMISPKDNS